MRDSRPKRPSHLLRGDARMALLGATLELVRRQGWAGTSVDQLCRAAGVTKGAFFHHFPTKEALGVAAAAHWSEVTGSLFATADYHRHADPLDRVLGYLDFRLALAEGPLEAFTCFAGTAVQETFATSPTVGAACGASITGHARQLERDLQAALTAYQPREPVTAASLALFTQTVLQGGFVVAKATGDRAPLLDAIAHLRRYFLHLFHTRPSRN